MNAIWRSDLTRRRLIEDAPPMLLMRATSLKRHHAAQKEMLLGLGAPRESTWGLLRPTGSRGSQISSA